MFAKISRALTRRADGRSEVRALPLTADFGQALACLMSRWQAQDVGLLSPVSASSVRAVFRRLGCVATPDVVALYATLGGMRDMDDGFLRLWPLDEIAAQRPSEQGVLFADYMMSCWEYRLVPTFESQSAVRVDQHHGGRPPRVGLTLEAFLVSHASDSEFLSGFG